LVEEFGEFAVIESRFGMQAAGGTGAEHLLAARFLGEVDVAAGGVQAGVAEITGDDFEVHAVDAGIGGKEMAEGVTGDGAAGWGRGGCIAMRPDGIARGGRIAMRPYEEAGEIGAAAGADDGVFDGAAAEGLGGFGAVGEERIAGAGGGAAELLDAFHKPKTEVSGGDVEFGFDVAEVDAAVAAFGFAARDIDDPALAGGRKGDIGHAQFDNFTAADSGGGEEGDEGAVALLDLVFLVLGMEDLLEFLGIKEKGIALAAAEGGEIGGDVGNAFGLVQPLEETADGGAAADTGVVVILEADEGVPGAEIVGSDLGGVDLIEVDGEGAEVGLITAQGVIAGTLKAEVVKIFGEEEHEENEK